MIVYIMCFIAIGVFTFKSPRVNPPNRIRSILEYIIPTEQTDRVSGNEHPHIRIIIPKSVVVKSSLSI